MRDDDRQARMQAQRQAIGDMRRTHIERQAREMDAAAGVAVALAHLDDTARPRRLARSLLDQGMQPAEARDALMARLGVSRATAYRMLAAVTAPPTF